MKYTEEEVMEYVEQEDVRFIRLAFCDPTGHQRNMAINPSLLSQAFEKGIHLDASAVPGFDDELCPDLYLFPIPSTLTTLPWRSAHGKVVRMFCHLCYEDGTPFELDSRVILEKAVEAAGAKNISVDFGCEMTFYLFQRDEQGRPTKTPLDSAGYMDTSPEDRGENIRREICLTLDEMEIQALSSRHEEGPGQNEIDFAGSDAVTAADNAVNFTNVVQAVAVQNGLCADFSPKPLPEESGNSFHIHISPKSSDGNDIIPGFMAGILDHIEEMTAFFNPLTESYLRLGHRKAPKYISWGRTNRTTLLQIQSKDMDISEFILCSPDPMANPYVTYALLIYAGLDGLERGLQLPDETTLNLLYAPPDMLENYTELPGKFTEAVKAARSSAFLQSILPERFLVELGE